MKTNIGLNIKISFHNKSQICYIQHGHAEQMGSTGLTKQPSVDDIKTLLDHGEYDEALLKIDQSDDSKIELQILKSVVLNLKGMRSRALEEAKEALIESKKINNKIYLMNAILHCTHFSMSAGKAEQNMIDQYMAEFQKIWNELTEAEKEKEEIKEIEGYYYRVSSLRDQAYNITDFEKIIHEMKKGIEIQKQLKHKYGLFGSLYMLAYGYARIGDYQKMYDVAKELQDLANKLNNKWGLSAAFGFFGGYYGGMGLYDKYEKYIMKKLEIDRDNNHRPGESLSYYHLGCIAYLKGEYDKALRVFSKSLALAEDLNMLDAIASRLYYLILTSLELKSENLISRYISKLQKFNSTSNSPQIDLYTKLAQAMIYKKKSRSKDKVEAQKLLEKIIDENLFFEDTMFAMLHLSELLFDELKTYGNEEVLKEVDDLTRKLYEMAQEHHLFYEIVHILILQSKLAFVDLKLDKAYKILQQAHLIAEERGLDHLIPKIETEEKNLEKDINQAIEISKIATPMQTRLEKSKIVNYIVDMQRMIQARN